MAWEQGLSFYFVKKLGPHAKPALSRAPLPLPMLFFSKKKRARAARKRQEVKFLPFFHKKWAKRNGCGRETTTRTYPKRNR